MLPTQTRCAYVMPSGRRCRIAALHPGQLCILHNDLNPAFPIAPAMVPDGDPLDTVEGIHGVMARILRGQALGKIRAREANAMMYTCQTLLFALPRLVEERKQILVRDDAELWYQRTLARSQQEDPQFVAAAPHGESRQAK